MKFKRFYKRKQRYFVHQNLMYGNFQSRIYTRDIRLTWRNPAFMAIAIALVWLIPQLFIRKIMEKKYERKKIEIQKNKIQKLYPTNPPK